MVEQDREEELLRNKISKGIRKDTSFSWNFQEAALELEDSISLHENIDFSCRNLGEFKDGVRKELGEALNKDVHVAELKEATQREMLINKKNSGLGYYEKIEETVGSLNEYLRLIGIGERKRGKIIGDLNGVIEKEKNKESDLEKFKDLNRELGKQFNFLDVLDQKDPNDFWDSLLKVRDNLEPRISIRMGEKEYTIKKGEKKIGIGKLEIGRAIREKIKEEIKGRRDMNEQERQIFIDEIANFLLRPFMVNGNYDINTLSYYIDGIIECIKEDDIVSTIIRKYIARKKVEKLNCFGEDLQVLKDAVGEIKEGKGGGKKGLISKNKEILVDEIEWNNISKLKLLSFVKYLESYRDDLGGYYKDVIKYFKEKLVGNCKGNFDDWIKIKESTIKINLNFETDEEFLDVSKALLKFLGKQFDEEKEQELKSIFNKINKDYNYGQNFDNMELEDVRNFFLYKLKFKVNGLNRNVLVRGDDEIVYLDSYDQYRSECVEYRNSHKRWSGPIAPWKQPTYLKVKEFEKYLPDSRQKDVNQTFKNIFGISVPILKISGNVDGCVLLKEMFRALVDKVNENEMKKVRDINGEIEEIKQEWLLGTNDERWVSAVFGIKLEQVADNMLERCSKDIKESGYIKKLEELEKSFFELKAGLEKCEDSNEFDKLETKFKEVEMQFIEEKGVKNRIERFYKTFLGYNSLKRGVFDYEGIIGESADILRKMVCLKKLFVCRDIELEDKFYYCDEILNNRPIKSRHLEHIEILKNIFGVDVVKNNYEIEELGQIESISSRFDKHEVVDKKYLESTLKGQPSSYRVDEVVALAILRAEMEESMSFLKDKFMSILDVLGIDDVEKDEIKMLSKMFPGALELYIKRSLSNGAFIFDESKVIDYIDGNFDFTVIQAGVLEGAIEYGMGENVLEYLGFFINDKDNMPFDLKNPSLKNTLKGLVKHMRQTRQGCFSSLPKDKDWHKLNFQKENDFIQKKEGAHKFCMGKSGQKFRFVGMYNHGFYVFLKYFNDHDDYEKYLEVPISDAEQTEFKIITGCDWDENKKRKDKKKCK